MPAAPTPLSANHSPVAFPRSGSSLYHALRLVPSERRTALLTWARWWHELARIPADVQDPGVAETKLRWWLQELVDTDRGQPHHPLMKEREAARLPADGAWPALATWQGQVEGLIQLVHQTRWMDEAHFARHAEQTTGRACEGAALLLGAKGDAAGAAARRLGLGLRMAHRLGRLGQDGRAGWVNVGIDVLQAHGVRAHQLTQPDASATPDGWAGLLADLQARATGPLDEALSAIRALPPEPARALRPLVALAHMARQQAQVVGSAGDAVLHQRLLLTPLRKAWITQRVAWGWLR
ncbi:MAG: squalene/phytoene synthase family protein [Burkholderiales bacterium]|nr:squalene/phytoene synthase family protein [Burkholderiales bacterium]MBH2016296.1 squalene/phytoene synthase family protein [Burkholderiales bacterium]